ncbi:hypothetical protein HOO65_070015 [Ceratocystis lukuohia]|uniref:Uncharacterized protein n=1 Tax=Ceratocystis lukuohia TaxID=2019550 RepID=A0ABR4MBB8_9PEZI
MQSWTVTFLLALAGTAIALPAVDVASTNDNIAARELKNCAIVEGNCICMGSDGISSLSFNVSYMNPETEVLDEKSLSGFVSKCTSQEYSFHMATVHDESLGRMKIKAANVEGE